MARLTRRRTSTTSDDPDLIIWRRIRKVIDSCTTPQQLPMAERWSHRMINRMVPDAISAQAMFNVLYIFIKRLRRRL